MTEGRGEAVNQEKKGVGWKDEGGRRSEEEENMKRGAGQRLVHKEEEEEEENTNEVDTQEKEDQKDKLEKKKKGGRSRGDGGVKGGAVRWRSEEEKCETRLHEQFHSYSSRWQHRHMTAPHVLTVRVLLVLCVLVLRVFEVLSS